MTLPTDTSAKFAEYANPEKIVSTEWLLENRDDVVLLESDEDILLYETGHIPGAIKIDWHTELTDSLTRDIIDGEQFARMASSKGISRGSTIVIYGDKSNWWAAYALWVFELFGHKDVRLLDGGRDKWISEGRELTTEKPSVKTTEYPIITRDDSKIRAFKPQVRASIGQLPLIDVRSPEEYTGERTHMPAYPEEGALRGGHIPTAASVPWSKAADEDSTFRTRAELEEIYIKGAGLTPGEPVTAYCRIGERSSHTYFVLKYLLGFTDVRNYDGSWTEWGNAVGVPIVRGAEPGKAA